MTIANAVNAHESPVAASTADVAAPAANAAAAVTYAGASGVTHCVGQLCWSYNGTPTGGNLKIEDGSGNTIFSLDITQSGPGIILFNPPKKGAAGNALIVTLAAGGSGVSSKVSITHWTE
jgi:hypothetical protein